MTGLSNFALSFAAGALSTLSPCVLPILPMVLFGVLEKHKLGPIALAFGLSFSFALVGIGIASIGFNVGIDSGSIRYAVAFLILGVGLVLLIPRLQEKFATAAGPVAAGGQALMQRIQPDGLLGQFVLGMLLGAIWSPCSGPTLGAAVGLAAQGQSLTRAALTMAIFGVGASTPILLLAYGSRRVILGRRDLLARSASAAKPVLGLIFAAVGLFVLTGFDKIAETFLNNVTPDWLSSLTTRF